MHSLDHMLRARSVAVVGASSRRGTVGDMTLRQLQAGGFAGPVYAINPGYQEIGDMRCLASIDDIGQPVDLAVLAVSNGRLEEETSRALQAGARSLAIFASCHGLAADGSLLRDRIAALADTAGVPICGGNGMGFLNVEEGLRVCGFYQPETLVPGEVTFLSHSGSMFSALLHNKRRIGFNLVVSTGLELNTRMSDYLDWALDLESTRVVALFLETVRDPDRFVAALQTAESRQVPVVALKVGASSRGRQAVATHSEAIAGDDAVFEALFEEYGVHRVLTADELADTIELFSAGRRAGPGGLGAVHDSGGERALLIDTAERVGVPLPDLGDKAVATLTELLDPGLEPANPVDAWGTGRDAEDVFVSALDALAADPGVGVVAFSVDLTEEEDPDHAYSAAVLEAAARTVKPVAVLANLSTTVDPTQATGIRAGGVAVLEGTETGLRAIRHLLDHTERAGQPPRASRLTTPRPPVPPGSDAFDLLAGYGISTPATTSVSSLEEAVAAAEEIGFPVVLKTVGLDHKTEVGGVALGLNDQTALELAYLDMSERLGPAAIVSRQIGPGTELAVGMVTDPQFGPLVVVSAGGVLIELLRDRVALFPPFDRPRAQRAVDRLAVRPLLDGHRGAPAGDVESLVDVLVRFSELVVDQTAIVSADLNPVIVGPGSAVAVDALVSWA